VWGIGSKQLFWEKKEVS